MLNMMKSLSGKPLAFSSSLTLTKATSRIPLTTSDNSAVLNIELFEENTDESSPILLFVHGVCESCETLGVQAIVSTAKENGTRVAVLELEGHGLSSGKKGLCGDFDRLIRHVSEFVNHTMTVVCKDSGGEVPYAMCGSSLGGVLAIYAADAIAKNSQSPGKFLGVAAIAPAVGVDARAVPNKFIVQVLKLLVFVAPSAQLSLTPLEDASLIRCPPNSKRNFSGHWLLATSKMLLDVTSYRVTADLNCESGSGKNLDLSKVPSLLVIGGEDDCVVPFDAMKNFYEKVHPTKKEFIKVPNVGHELMCVKPSLQQVTSSLFRWLLSQNTPKT